MLAEAAARALEPVRLGRLHHDQGAHRLTDRSDAPKPGVPREIVSSRERHRRRRRQPRFHPDLRTRRDPGWQILLVERDPDVRRKRTAGGRDEQPDRVPGSQIIDRFDPARHIANCRAAEPRLRHPIRAHPNQCATEGRRQREPAERAARAAAAQDKADQRQRRRCAEEGCPLVLRVKREPRRDSAPSWRGRGPASAQREP